MKTKQQQKSPLRTISTTNLDTVVGGVGFGIGTNGPGLTIGNMVIGSDGKLGLKICC